MKKIILIMITLGSMLFSSCLSTLQNISISDPFVTGNQQPKSFIVQVAHSMVKAWDEYKYPIKESSNNGIDPFHHIISNFFFSSDHLKNIENFQRYTIFDEDKLFFYIFFSLVEEETIDGTFHTVNINEPSEFFLNLNNFHILGMVSYNENGTLENFPSQYQVGLDSGTTFVILAPGNLSYSDFQQAVKENPFTPKYYLFQHYKK